VDLVVLRGVVESMYFVGIYGGFETSRGMFRIQNLESLGQLFARAAFCNLLVR